MMPGFALKDSSKIRQQVRRLDTTKNCTVWMSVELETDYLEVWYTFFLICACLKFSKIKNIIKLNVHVYTRATYVYCQGNE